MTAPAQRPASLVVDRVVRGDCVENLAKLPVGCVDLVFADPPFNIGYEYDVYEDRLEREQYLDWSREWMSGVHRALKPTGTFWLAIGDEYAAELKLLAQDIGFVTRSWVIWYYTFGVNCKQKFTRSHAHLFYFVKDPQEFTFRWEEPENRIPSARQLVYGDKRANPKGRLPDDTWILRPQDLGDCFTSAEDTWYLPRVAGTFKERAGFHGCQMPEQLLGRIIKYCSNPGELVLDPFSGSASTLVVARKLGRGQLGFELSKEYSQRGNERLAETRVGDPLTGSDEPTLSAPETPKLALPRLGQGTSGAELRNAALAEHRSRQQPDSTEPRHNTASLSPEHVATLIEAFRSTHDGWSLDRLLVDPDLSRVFIDECRVRGLAGTPRDWTLQLLRLRKSGALTSVQTTRPTVFGWEECDDGLAACEIAWKLMLDKGFKGLDEILADPELAGEFDTIAACLAPGVSPVTLRWAALKLRKEGRVIRSRAAAYADDPPAVARWMPLPLGAVPKGTPALYSIRGCDDEQPLYLGATLDLAQRVATHLKSAAELPEAFRALGGAGAVWSYLPFECSLVDLLAVRARVMGGTPPKLQVPDLCAAIVE
jgi:DNA modification methylase